MAETYKKVGSDLEVTKTDVRLVTELELLEQKKRLTEDKQRAIDEEARIDAQIVEIDKKLDVVNKP